MNTVAPKNADWFVGVGENGAETAIATVYGEYVCHVDVDNDRGGHKRYSNAVASVRALAMSLGWKPAPDAPEWFVEMRDGASSFHEQSQRRLRRERRDSFRAARKQAFAELLRARREQVLTGELLWSMSGGWNRNIGKPHPLQPYSAEYATMTVDQMLERARTGS